MAVCLFLKLFWIPELILCIQHKKRNVCFFPAIQGLEASCQSSATSFSLGTYASWLRQLHCSYSCDLEDKLMVLQSLQYTSECLGHVCGVWEREVAGVRGMLPWWSCLFVCLSCLLWLVASPVPQCMMIKQHNQIRFLHRLILNCWFNLLQTSWMALITPLPHTVTRVAKISDPLELKYSEEEFGHVERDRGVCDESGDNGSWTIWLVFIRVL